uniref:3'-5' exonuclease domain-containing protein n=1 Tax=Tetradesmus obliquus TaxID=3088 RepID=A0A383VJ90_TETOB|eukprot:jgi/Sobl393_1/10744/SZX64802.1
MQQLDDVLLHMTAAGLAALDAEYFVQQGDSSSSSSGCSSAAGSSVDEDGGHQTSSWQLPAVHNCSQQRMQGSNLQLALLQLMVPAAEAADGAWPAAIYLVQVPQQRAAAQQVVAKLQPLLEDVGIVKVVHDGRQDAEILHRDFGVTVKGSLDTQLLAGLAGLGAASSSGDNTQPDTTTAANSSWSDCIRRMRLNELSLLYGYAYTDVPSHKRGGTAGWLQRPLPPRAVAYAAGDVRYLLPLAHDLLQQLPAVLTKLSELQLQLAQQGTAAAAAADG